MAQRVAGELYESITGQLFEIGRQLRQPNGYPFDPSMLKSILQDAIEGKFGNGQVVARVVDTGDSIDWRSVYEKLGLLEDLETFLAQEVNAQACADQTVWSVPVLKAATSNRVVKALRDLGVNVWLYTDDLDQGVPTNDRDSKDGSYMVRFKKNLEADPENANQSANDRKARGANDITLLERLLLELGYFLATGKHLDAKNVTLCAGSRGSGGRVPHVSWGPGNREVCVGWCNPVSRAPSLRSRAAVS